MTIKIYYNLKKTINFNYKLIKNSDFEFLTDASFTPKVVKRFDDINRTETIKKQFGSLIVKFFEVINKNFSNLDLSIMYNNLNTVSTSTKKFEISNIVHGTNKEGAYLPFENEIELQKKNYYSTIFHELFHASSTIVDNESNTIFCGFEQIKNNYEIIAVGINEGYTQYLTEEYFKDVIQAYSYEKIIASVVETIVGKQKMQSLYFTANLKGLIEYLSQYETYDEIFKFLHTLDCVSMDLGKNKSRKLYQSNIIKSMRYINSFLIECSTKKYILSTNNGISDKKQFRNDLKNIINMLPYNVSINNKIYYLRDKKLISDALISALSLTDFELSDRKIKHLVNKLNNL